MTKSHPHVYLLDLDDWPVTALVIGVPDKRLAAQLALDELMKAIGTDGVMSPIEPGVVLASRSSARTWGRIVPVGPRLGGDNAWYWHPNPKHEGQRGAFQAWVFDFDVQDEDSAQDLHPWLCTCAARVPDGVMATSVCPECWQGYHEACRGRALELGLGIEPRVLCPCKDSAHDAEPLNGA